MLSVNHLSKNNDKIWDPHKLICDRSVRLGKNGLSDFREHPFFAGIEWETIRDQVPPYIPEIESPTDTSNFPDQLEEYRIIKDPPPTGNNIFTGKHLPFVGFTYTKSSRLSGNTLSSAAAENSSQEKSVSTAPVPAPRKKEEPQDEEIRKELQSLKEAYNFQTKELASAMEKIDQITVENANRKSAAIEQSEETERLKIFLDKLERENATLKSNLEKVAAEQKVSDVFSSRLDSLHDELEESQALHLEKDAHIEQLTSQFESVSEELSSKKDGETIQRQRIASLEREVNGLESQITSLRFINKPFEKLTRFSYRLDDENREGWESYLRSITKWVRDEKDARNYLEVLAEKMGEELEALRRARDAQVPLQQHLNSCETSPRDGSDRERWQTLRNSKKKQAKILEIER